MTLDNGCRVCYSCVKGKSMFEFCIAFNSKRLGTHYYNVSAPNKRLAVGLAAARMTVDLARFFDSSHQLYDRSLRIGKPKLVKAEKRIRDRITLFS